jgi:hypothetical protein
MWELYATITNMESLGYPPDAIFATVRSMIEAECRGEDEYWCEREADRAAREAEERRALAGLVYSVSDPFAA